MKTSPGEFPVADPHKPASLGAEERLDHDVSSQGLEGRQGLDGGLAGPGRRHRQPGLVEQGQCQELVDGRLHGSGRVPDGNARGGHPMQGVHPKDDLLQAAGGHHPHEHAVDLGECDIIGCDPLPPPAHLGENPWKGDGLEPDVERFGRAPQVGDMPAGSRNKGDEGGHPHVRGRKQRSYPARVSGREQSVLSR